MNDCWYNPADAAIPNKPFLISYLEIGNAVIHHWVTRRVQMKRVRMKQSGRTINETWFGRRYTTQATRHFRRQRALEAFMICVWCHGASCSSGSSSYGDCDDDDDDDVTGWTSRFGSVARVSDGATQFGSSRGQRVADCRGIWRRIPSSPDATIHDTADSGRLAVHCPPPGSPYHARYVRIARRLLGPRNKLSGLWRLRSENLMMTATSRARNWLNIANELQYCCYWRCDMQYVKSRYDGN